MNNDGLYSVTLTVTDDQKAWCSDTAHVEISGIDCTAYSLSLISKSFGSSGGLGSIGVTATSGCSWNVSSNASWINITSGSSGTGNGTVSYSVSGNTGSSRTGTITIAGKTFTVTQDNGPIGTTPCPESISPVSKTFGSDGGTDNMSVVAPDGCNWTASSSASWINITSSSSGSGNGTVNYSVLPNTGSSRTGTITIASKTFTVTQDGGLIGTTPCPESISPVSKSLGPVGGTDNVNVVASDGCNWTASSSASWINIAFGSSRSGNGTVSYSVSANTGSSRTGTITIVGDTSRIF